MQVLSRCQISLAKSFRPTTRLVEHNRLRIAKMISSKGIDNSKGNFAPQSALLTNTKVSEQIEQEELFYRYTSGRWLFREEEQMAKRYVRFNVFALKQAAADALKSPCISIAKLPEGLYNKVFLLKMGNGQELIAKIPNPNAGVEHLTVASEVATLDFLRNVAKIPVPEVYAWNSRKSNSNPVGAEYIIMAKVPGHELSHIWPEMSASDQLSLVKSVVQLESKLASIKFSQYGSLYYADDETFEGYPSNLSVDNMVLQSEKEALAKFAIGRTVERGFWAEGRSQIDIVRGPWVSAEGYFSAVAKREIAWITYCGTGDTISDPSKSKLHVKLLEQFLLVLPYIIPTEDDIHLPTLWHTDLHRGNIFVVDSFQLSRISGIIDWQGLWLAPFFRQARFASVFDSDWNYPWGAVMPPPLRADIDSLSADEKQSAQLEYTEVKLKKFYEVASRKLNPRLFRALDAMQIEDNYLIPAIFDLVGRSWIDGPLPLRHLLIQVTQRWSSLASDKNILCPISFSEAEVAMSEQEMEKWADAYNEFQSLRSRLVGKDGWVSHEDYHAAKAQLEDHKEQLKDLQAKLKAAGGTDADNVV